MYVVGRRAAGTKSAKLYKASDSEHGATGFGICPSELWSIFGSISPIPPLFHFGIVMYTLGHCMQSRKQEGSKHKGAGWTKESVHELTHSSLSREQLHSREN